MEETRRNLWVGLFVLCGLGAVGALVVIFGRGPQAILQGKTYPLRVHFEQVSDIRQGNLVLVKGIRIGSVSDVRLVDPTRFDRGVEVELAIELPFTVRQGSYAQATEPVLGQGRPPIYIIPGDPEAPALPAGSTMPGEVRRAIDSIFPPGVVNNFETAAKQIGQAAEDLSPVLRELEKVIHERSPEEVDRGEAMGNIASAAARLDSSLKHFNEVLGDPNVKSQLRETVANVQQMSADGKKVMNDLNVATGDARGLIANVNQAVSNLDSRTEVITQNLVDSLDKASRVLDDVNLMTTQARRGEGNLGLLLTDEKLYESLLVTTERLGLAVDEFRALVSEWRQGKVKVGF